MDLVHLFELGIGTFHGRGRLRGAPRELPETLHAHFDLILVAIAAARMELVRLHRAGQIDDETLHELERDLDLEELSAISAKA